MSAKYRKATAGSSGADSAMRGAAITMGGRAIRLVCQLAGLVVLARFLSPTEYGLVAMAGAVVGVAAVLGDFGVSLSALRSPELPPAERNALFWFSTGLGAAFAVVSIAVGPALAVFYREPSVTMIVVALSPLFVVSGASSQYRVDAARQGRYVWIAVAETVSAVVGLIAGVVAAVSGLGYWALILQNWVVSVIVLVIVVVAGRWSPGWPARGGNLRHHIGFGSFSTMTQLANYVSSNVTSVALGRFLGPATVGTFSRAQQLFNLPVDQITAPLTPILLPLLARVAPERLQDTLQRIQRCLVYSVLGICLMIAVGGAPLAAVLLGPQWAEAGDIVQILMAGAIFQLSGYVYYWAFLTAGRSQVLFWCEVPARVVMTGLVVIGSSQGVWGAAIGHSVGLAVCWLVPAVLGVRSLGWRIGPLALGAGRPVLLYLGAFSVGAIVRNALDQAGFGALPSLLITLAATAAAVAVGLVLPVYRRDGRELLHLASALRRRRLPDDGPA